MACNKENGCDCEILGVRCLPENSFVDNTDKGCNGVYIDSRCIRINGLKGIVENSRLNSVLRDLLVAIRDQSKGRIVTSPNGTRYLISVDDNGALITTQV